jgi:hypothetical protein
LKITVLAALLPIAPPSETMVMLSPMMFGSSAVAVVPGTAFGRRMLSLMRFLELRLAPDRARGERARLGEAVARAGRARRVERDDVARAGEAMLGAGRDAGVERDQVGAGDRVGLRAREADVGAGADVHVVRVPARQPADHLAAVAGVDDRLAVVELVAGELDLIATDRAGRIERRARRRLRELDRGVGELDDVVHATVLEAADARPAAVVIDHGLAVGEHVLADVDGVAGDGARIEALVQRIVEVMAGAGGHRSVERNGGNAGAQLVAGAAGRVRIDRDQVAARQRISLRRRERHHAVRRDGDVVDAAVGEVRRWPRRRRCCTSLSGR